MRAILPAAGLLTIAAAGAAVVVHDGSTSSAAASRQDLFAVSSGQAGDAAAGRTPAVLPQKVAAGTISRSAERPPLPNEAAAENKVEGQRFAVKALEIHANAADSSPVLASVKSGDQVDITGVIKGNWAQIIHKGLPRWVPVKNIAKAMPVKVVPIGTSPCASGSEPENGLRPDTIKVHRAVCAKFPSIATYGGLAGRGEHATGQAIDIMIAGDVAIGQKIADFAQANAAKLGISQVIWQQRIWTVQRAGDGWRAMSDRGSPTANHMDHVHVTTFGDSAP
ncbi:SH3 domain-containing protein [Aeromicrobium sp.]|uniref:SH3 domain-containing protein n=1 Tax=Aeromicrobium sp. TaxID=1871063 RepID=UPI0019A6045B|nr:SH3 domain-containing protein [Aeromicrobium sp.]MBC7632851.1 SH3 domain-containing protein [Aeromicrobium sp.]